MAPPMSACAVIATRWPRAACRSTTAWSSRACIPLIPACIAAIGCWIAPTGPAPFSPATTTWRRACYAHARGIKVPDELSVAGYDDTPLSRQTWPKLTTLRQPIRDMAYAAVEQLVSREPQARVRTLGYEIVVRDSTRALG